MEKPSFNILKSLVFSRVKMVVAAFILMLVFILIEFMQGGVITHHLLAREDLPGISNWWGLLSVPVLAWFVASINQMRKKKLVDSKPALKSFYNKVLKNLTAGFLFGMVASILWAYNFDYLLRYFILLPFLVAIFTALHYPESLFGFVIGMAFIFGGILPIIVGIVLLTGSFIINALATLLKKAFVLLLEKQNA